MSAPAPASRDARAALLSATRAELMEHGHAAISLRAVARRAGVSHAAPQYFFADRAGLLTAVATEGFGELAAALGALAVDDAPSLAALGEAYISFGLRNPALFDLMFRPSELHPDDADLARARAAAIGLLESSAARAASQAEPAASGMSSLTLLSWALAHGIAVLTRDGALPAAAGADSASPTDLARHLVGVFDALVTAAT